MSRLERTDLVFVMSVGGGNLEKNVSPNLVQALELARERGARIAGIVGRDGGHTARLAHACVIVPTINPESVTPHTRSHAGPDLAPARDAPKLKRAPTKWESVVEELAKAQPPT